MNSGKRRNCIRRETLSAIIYSRVPSLFFESGVIKKPPPSRGPFASTSMKTSFSHCPPSLSIFIPTAAELEIIVCKTAVRYIKNPRTMGSLCERIVTTASNPTPSVLSIYSVRPFSSVIKPKSTGAVSPCKARDIASLGLVGMPQAKAKSFPEPMGTTPIAGRFWTSTCIRPLTTS